MPNLEPKMIERRDNKAVRILAKSMYKELTSQGYDARQIVSLATELISEVTHSISSQASPARD